MFCSEHYSFECGCRSPVAPPTTPAHVWVVVEIYTRAIQVGRAPATDPIQGRMAIFSRPEVQQVTAAKIHGVFTSRAVACALIPSPPPEGSEFLVECHAVENGLKQVAAPVVVEQKCALCNAPASTTFCRSCEHTRLAELRALNAEAIVQESGPRSTFEFTHPLPNA